jgi:hypothetical protein
VTAIADGLHFRADGQSLYDRNPRSSVETDVAAPYRSEVLEVRRTLWVESDHMDAPGENDGPFDGDPGADDDPRFTPADPTIATLTALLEPAYVRVLPLPAEYDTHDTTTFKHYQNNTNVNPAVKDVDSSRYFWDVHMLGAYEWSMDQDNDPNSQAWLAGFSEMGDDGTNFVLQETVRDLWAEPELPDMVPYATGLDRVSAHEAMHRILGWHKLDPVTRQPIPDDPSNQGIMDGDTLMTAATVELTGLQIRMVQAKDHPE